MAARRGHSLALDAITHRFGDVTAVRDITLDIAAGELVALLGPSSCDKTTLFRIISGFLTQTRGGCCSTASRSTHLSSNRRGVGIVFQNYALFPHMRVCDNVAYGLEARGDRRSAIGPRVEEMLMLRLVHMEGFGARLPGSCRAASSSG